MSNIKLNRLDVDTNDEWSVEVTDANGVEVVGFNVTPIPSFCGGIFLHNFFADTLFLVTKNYWLAVLERIHGRAFNIRPGMRITWWDADDGDGTHIAEAVGARCVEEFVNPNSGNRVRAYMYTVPDVHPFNFEEDEEDDFEDF